MQLFRNLFCFFKKMTQDIQKENSFAFYFFCCIFMFFNTKFRARKKMALQTQSLNESKSFTNRVYTSTHKPTQCFLSKANLTIVASFKPPEREV